MAGFKFSLWSTLSQSSKRQMFFTDKPSETTEGDFMSKVNGKLKENNVPAEIEPCEVNWDGSNESSNSYYVKLQVANPLVCLLKFCHVGNFSFVENRTFIEPPVLPKVPGKPKILDTSAPGRMWSNLMWAVILFVLMGITVSASRSPFGYGFGDNHASFVMGGMAFFFLISALVTWNGYSENKAWNELCRTEEQLWLEAWQKWEDTNLNHAFQETTTGTVSKIFDAVFETVKQVSSEEFSGVRHEDREELTGNEKLQALAEAKKKAYR